MKDLSTELGKVIESWRSLRLDPIEYRLVEVLSLTGRGKNFKFLLGIHTDPIISIDPINVAQNIWG